jgi:hypothetical protein
MSRVVDRCQSGRGDPGFEIASAKKTSLAMTVRQKGVIANGAGKAECGNLSLCLWDCFVVRP